MAKRKPIPDPIQKELRRFYVGKRCVVSLKKSDDEAIDYHHLDENNQNSKSRFNLVPLLNNINRTIDAHRKNPDHPFHKELEPDQLKAKLLRHHVSGQFAAAYGCARIGAFLLATHHDDFDKALQFTSFALLASRSIWAVEEASDTIKRNAIPIIVCSNDKSGLAPLSLSQLCVEIGSFFVTCASFENAYKWFELALRYCNNRVLTKENEQQKGRVLLKLAETFIGRSDVSSGVLTLDKYVDLGLRGDPWGRTTEQHWRARATILDGNRKQLDRHLEGINDALVPIDEVKHGDRLGMHSYWGYAEAMLTLSEIKRLQGQPGWMDHTHETLEFYKSVRIPPNRSWQPRAIDEYEKKYNIRTSRRKSEDLDDFVGLAEQVFDLLKTPGNARSIIISA